MQDPNIVLDVYQKRGQEDQPLKGETTFDILWHVPASKRTEVVQRLLSDKCELCGVEGVELEAHHIRKMADVKSKDSKPLPRWKETMHARRRKTLMVCSECHNRIHAGRYDGVRIR